jgi:hypothetical protein
MSRDEAAPTAGIAPPTASGHETGNVVRLAVAQALAGANSVVVYATGAIVGNTLAPIGALATLPISVFVVGMAACTLPAGAIARRHGRRRKRAAGARAYRGPWRLLRAPRRRDLARLRRERDPGGRAPMPPRADACMAVVRAPLSGDAPARLAAAAGRG